MNQIPQEIIDRILDEVDIVTEISEDITLHKKGAYARFTLRELLRLLSLRQKESANALAVEKVVT